MFKHIALILSMIFVIGIAYAGEYQPESIEYERAFAAGNYAEAVELATTKVGEGNALNAQGYMLYLEGPRNYKAAQELLEEAIASDPLQYWAYNTLGAIFVYQGEIEAGIAMFQKSAAVNATATDAGAAARVEKAKHNIEVAESL